MNTRSSTYPANGSEPRGAHSEGGFPVLSGLLLTGLLLIALPSGARAQDDWFGPDKILHFIGGFVCTGAGYVVARDAWDWEHDRAVSFGVGVGVTCSIAKELYDAFVKRTYFSGKDLVWDGLGIGLGVIVVNAMEESDSGTTLDALLSGRTGRFGGLRAAARLDCSHLARQAILNVPGRPAIGFMVGSPTGSFPRSVAGSVIAVDTGLRPSTLRLPRDSSPPGSFRFEGD